MKLVQISDIHLVEPGRLLYGSSSADNLERCVAHINAHHADAALAVATGDLAEDGSAEQYACIRSILDRLAMPYRVIPGNHDRREALRDGFGLTEAADGRLCQALSLQQVTVLLLDTLAPGKEWGELGPDQLEWLRQRLDAAEGPVLVFMHHPPIAIGHRAMDDIRLRDDAAFLDLVARSGKVRHVFFGHVHRPFATLRHGIGYSAVPGTNHQVSLEGMDRGELWACSEPPGYGLALVHEGEVSVHFQSFAEARVFAF